jgi:nucleoside-diphosphate-sugar epimerase
MVMKKRIAVTGAGGYIGRMLIERLSGRDEVERVVAIDKCPPPALLPKVEWAQRDVRDASLARVLRGCDVVVHLAFIVAAIHDLEETYSINLGGTRNVLAACEAVGIAKLVAASSVAAYGVQPRDNRLITEDTPLRGDGRSYYLHTKRLVEEDLDVFERRNPGVIVTRLRPSILLGPRNNNFAHELGRLRFRVHVWEGAYLPVVHEEDVVDAFVLALQKDAPGAFIISLPEPAPLSELAPRPAKVTVGLGTEQILKLSRIAYALHLTLLSPDWIVAVQGNWRFDISRSRELLGWEPKHDLAATIREMMENINRGRGFRRWLKKR